MRSSSAKRRPMIRRSNGKRTVLRLPHPGLRAKAVAFTFAVCLRRPWRTSTQRGIWVEKELAFIVGRR